MLDLSNIKKRLSYIPLKSRSNEFDFTHLLGKVKRSKGVYIVCVGTRPITALTPQEFKISDSYSKSYAIVDGKLSFMEKASNFYVNDDFKILDNKNDEFCSMSMVHFR